MKLFLEGYDGQTIQQLIALQSSHRIDSIILALEQALNGKPESDLSETERVVIVIEAMEREVNNGGYEQLFANAPAFTNILVDSLEKIGCAKCASISMDAIAALELPAQFDVAAIERAVSELSDQARRKLEECDARYFESDESIEQRLFAFVEANQLDVRLP